MMSLAGLLGVIVACGSVVACAPLPPPPAEIAAQQQCPVCRYNRDFGCLEITKSPTTPQASHQGRRYWFCSAACRRGFVADPSRYTTMHHD